ncbi:MAG: hypothetical protein EOP34_11815 [Rickettsiales bacterium]|nr:MAG: hypothetical protein EOP34_11815 [Rickettsiales bacterium]
MLTVNGLIRTDKHNYPVLAMREGILNAIVHRDYNSVNGFLQVSIFSDRTEIANYGNSYTISYCICNYQICLQLHI